jgi:hypothetical protein
MDVSPDARLAPAFCIGGTRGLGLAGVLIERRHRRAGDALV